MIAAGGGGRRREAVDADILCRGPVYILHPAGIEIVTERLLRRHAHDIEAYRLRAAVANAHHGLRGVLQHIAFGHLEREAELRMQEAAAAHKSLARVFAINEIIDGREIAVPIAFDGFGRRILPRIRLRVLHALGRRRMRREEIQRARIGRRAACFQRRVALHRGEEARRAERIEFGA